MFRKNTGSSPVQAQPLVASGGDPFLSGTPVGATFRLQNDLYALDTNPDNQWQVMSDPRNSVVTIFEPKGGGYKVDLCHFRRNGKFQEVSVGGRILPIHIGWYKGAYYARWVPEPPVLLT